MQLIKCPACHNDISEEAQSCPKCGQPVTEKMRNSGVTQDIARSNLRRSSGKRALIVVAIIAAIVIFFAWISTQTGSSSGGNSGGNASKQGSPTTAQTQARTSPASPIFPAHNYSYEKDGEYGYESELSQDQIEAGVASAPMLMVRYLGQRRGRYRAEIVSGASTSVLSCSSPCSYITARDYYHNPYSGSELIDKEVIPAGNTVAAGIMQDAMNGQLIPYDQTRTGKAATAKRAAYEQDQKQRELRQQQEFAAQQKAWQARESAERETQQKQMEALQTHEKQSRQLAQLRNLHQSIPELTSWIQSEKRRYRAYARNDTEGVLSGYYRSRLSEFKRGIAKNESESASEKKALYSGARAFLKEWCQTGSADPASKDVCKAVQGYLVNSSRP